MRQALKFGAFIFTLLGMSSWLGAIISHNNPIGSATLAFWSLVVLVIANVTEVKR